MSSNQMQARLYKEKKNFETNPPPNVMAGLRIEDDYTKWWAHIFGPLDTPYENGIFELEININANYPFKAPDVKFITPIFHPNIYDGNICLDILKDKWSPALNIEKVLLSISSLLCEPNPDDPLDRDAAQLYKFNRDKFNAKAKDFTWRYAINKEEL
ncbi:hypothetical protein H311_02202 [Anncaliia algerae PRA109]|uniref:E2 ubiquitin-conjugating enzyme n=2 Tax=Opisthokonta TaxID=33154 RepID=A0A059F4E5_9MICR|nr:hypothetical protein H311_02202 [Anncaliia algerae PRA109]KCZ82138.1 hypothetical protein H312_00415 [Anncaliia algerae PRA339]